MSIVVCKTAEHLILTRSCGRTSGEEGARLTQPLRKQSDTLVSRQGASSLSLPCSLVRLVARAVLARGLARTS